MVPDIREQWEAAMSAQIRFISRRRDRLNREQAAELRQLLLPVVNDDARPPGIRLTARRLITEIARETAAQTSWRFVMISPGQFAAVTRHLRLKSCRPAYALDLWSMCLKYLDFDTGEILQSRSALAAELGVSAKVVSQLMGELVACGAISRDFEDEQGNRGRAVRYFLNPRVGTNLHGEARAAAQAAAPLLKVIDGTSHPSQRRSRASIVPVVL